MLTSLALTSDNVKDLNTPSLLRKGVAAQLMTRVISEATSRGLSCVYAYVRADNKVTSAVIVITPPL